MLFNTVIITLQGMVMQGKIFVTPGFLILEYQLVYVRSKNFMVKTLD